MEIFKQLNKKGYKHYYEGTVEELDSMDKDNQHLYSEIMQIIMWLYEKHGIWIYISDSSARLGFRYQIQRLKILGENNFSSEERYNSPIEAYEDAIKYCLEKII